MKQLSRLTAFAFALACPALAHADTLQNYALNTTLTGGASAHGNVIFDETTGLFTGGVINATLNGDSFSFFNFAGSGVQDTVTYLILDQPNGNDFQLTIPGVSDKNYAGGPICSATSNSGCLQTGGSTGAYYISGFSYNGTTYRATSGNLVPTPEPSSLLLLGTGLIGIAGAARRRFAL